MTNQQLWQAILGSLEISLSKANFNTWFKNTTIAERGPDFIIIGVPSDFYKNWIANKYQTEILKSLKNIAPEIKELRYQLGNSAAAAKPAVKAENQPQIQSNTTIAREKAVIAPIVSSLN